MRTAFALILLTIGAAMSCSVGTTPTDPAPRPIVTQLEPVCALLADGADSPRADAQWAALVAEYGTLDYSGGTIVQASTGRTIGYALTEDSDIWSDPTCLTFRSDVAR